MKKITNKTILRKGHKTFQPVEVDGVVYWVDNDQEVLYPNRGIDNKNNIYKAINPTVRYKEGITDFNHINRKQRFGVIVAQSQPKLEGVPVISLDSYVERLKKGISESSKLATDTQEQFWIGKAAGFGEALQIYNKSNPNQYTQKDIDKAIGLAREINGMNQRNQFSLKYKNKEEILEAINSISVIELDEKFNILSYD